MIKRTPLPPTRQQKGIGSGICLFICLDMQSVYESYCVDLLQQVKHVFFGILLGGGRVVHQLLNHSCHFPSNYVEFTTFKLKYTLLFFKIKFAPSSEILVVKLWSFTNFKGQNPYFIVRWNPHFKYFIIKTSMFKQ